MVFGIVLTVIVVMCAAGVVTARGRAHRGRYAKAHGGRRAWSLGGGSSGGTTRWRAPAAGG
jgi:hypothetical protein